MRTRMRTMPEMHRQLRQIRLIDMLQETGTDLTETKTKTKERKQPKPMAKKNGNTIMEADTTAGAAATAVPLDFVMLPPNALSIDLDSRAGETYDDAAFKELCESVKLVGIVNPIRAYIGSDSNAHVTEGRRRVKAAIAVGLPEIPVVIAPEGNAESLDPMKVMLMAFHANNVVKSEGPMDYAKMIRWLKTEKEMKSKEVAKVLNRSASWVTQYDKLNDVPEDVQALVGTEAFTAAAAIDTMSPS